MKIFPVNLLKIVKSKTQTNIRLGKKNDGGYVILDGLDYDLLIGCGISNDDSFEHDFLKIHPNLKCFAFDGTINHIPHPHPNITFIKKNIGSSNTSETSNLEDLLENHHHIFLKMDIDGAEYPWLHSISEKQLLSLSQIVIEFHSNCFDLSEFDEYKTATLEKLLKTHYLVHLHGNNYKPVSSYFTERIFIGDSELNQKMITLTNEYSKDTVMCICHGYPDTFSYTFNKHNLIITGPNNSSGWKQNLVGYINMVKVPDVIECTYVRKDLLKNIIENNDPIPGKFDQPNNPLDKDISLSGHPYNYL